MPIVALPDRSVITVTGADAEHLLQNIVTTDLDALTEGEAKPGALLTPQGKILFDFLVSRAGPEAFRLDVRSDAASDFQRRLMLYKLRAKADISVDDQILVSAAWGNDSGASETDSTQVADTRFKNDAVGRTYTRRHPGHSSAADAGAKAAEWTALRIANGVAESGSDYALGEAFPHDVLLDQMDGVGMRKGCYIGQEVVSRMQHRGTARRRVLFAESQGSLPATSTDIVSGGKSLGTLGSVQGRCGLAIVRIDRVKDAMDAGTPIEAGGVALTLSIPQWAKFRFPETPESEPA